MSSENTEKLEEVALCFTRALEEKDDEVGEKLFDMTADKMSELVATGDKDILPGLIELFWLPNLEDTGICETLENEIFQHFQWKQIFDVLKQKLNGLIEHNINRAVHFAGACDIYEIKELMSELPLNKALMFLSKLRDRCRLELSEQIKLLLKELQN